MSNSDNKIKNFVNILRNRDFTKFSKEINKEMSKSVKTETDKLVKK